MIDKNKPQICTYCGEEKAPWDEDHVPPQALIGFEHDYKVPSCKDCNGGSSKDDEYFLFAVVMAKACDEHPNISEVRQKIFRSLGEEKAKRYRDLILRNVDPPSLPDSKIDFGNYVERIKNVASRIIKGLYYKSNNQRIPDTHKVTVFIGNEFCAYGTQNIERFRVLFKPLFAIDEESIGAPGVFDYCYTKIADEDPYSTVWYMRFYGGYEFFAHILPEGDRRQLATHFTFIHNGHLLPKLATIFVPSCSELSEWVADQLGEPLEQREDTSYHRGVIPVLSGRLGKYREPEK